jgi:shikimate kinase / 3-dehydroquinate synthase
MNLSFSGPDLFNRHGSNEPAAAVPLIQPANLILAGPPGSGKSTLGKALAEKLGRPFISTDEEIERSTGMSIPEIFSGRGESAFRELEARACRRVAAGTGQVIAAGGGALLDGDSREALDASGMIVVLDCETPELIKRLKEGDRPLLGPDPAQTLPALLETRQHHYQSFSTRVNVSGLSVQESMEQILALVQDEPAFRSEVKQSPPSRLVLGDSIFSGLDTHLQELSLKSPFAVISDTNTGPLYGQQIAEHLGGSHIQIPAGEQSKTLDTLKKVYDHLYAQRMERQGTIVAVGGGVIGDLAGMAAATYLRGLRWVNAATSLLAMVDSSLGGKVAVDLPQGKNLVGAFHSPVLILSDTRVLDTLPEAEFRCGMAELIKAAVIGDPLLFEWLETGARPSPIWIQRAVQVKARIVEEDPYEQGIRASLNLGHTIGHSIEAASGFSFSHGEAVAVGMLVESMLAEKLSLAKPGLTERIRRVISHYDMPQSFNGASPEKLYEGLRADKKNVNRQPAFALPIQPGEVRIGCRVPGEVIRETLAEMQELS